MDQDRQQKHRGIGQSGDDVRTQEEDSCNCSNCKLRHQPSRRLEVIMDTLQHVLDILDGDNLDEAMATCSPSCCGCRGPPKTPIFSCNNGFYEGSRRVVPFSSPALGHREPDESSLTRMLMTMEHAVLEQHQYPHQQQQQQRRRRELSSSEGKIVEHSSTK